MTTFPVSKRDKSVRAIVEATFPAYRGRKIKVSAHERPIYVESYWSGGSRSYFKAVDLRDLSRVLTVPQNGTPFDGGPISPDGVVIPDGYAIVEHAIFSGHDMGLTIHVNASSLPRFIEGGTR